MLLSLVNAIFQINRKTLALQLIILSELMSEPQFSSLDNLLSLCYITKSYLEININYP